MNIFKKFWHKFLDIFGDIKVCKYPLWISYDPYYFKMPGKEILEILKHIKVGDVILRGYDSYADGYFIPEVEGHGRYSHAGLYTGLDMVTHAISPYVQKTHLIEFLECDRVAVLRPKKSVTKAMKKADMYSKKKTKYDFNFEAGDKELYCFEMCAECYSYLDVPKKDAKLLKGLIHREGCYLASSFFDSNDFRLVYEHNDAEGRHFNVFCI